MFLNATPYNPVNPLQAPEGIQGTGMGPSGLQAATQELLYGQAKRETAESVDPFAGLTLPTLDALINRTAKWYWNGCAAGESDVTLAQLTYVHASLLQARELRRIAERLERPNIFVRFWRWIILPAEDSNVHD